MQMEDKDMALTETQKDVAENALVSPFTGETEKESINLSPPSQNVEFDGDIDLSATRKKRFRIDGDNNRYLELNTSDMSIVTRLDNLYPKLEKLSQEASIKQLDKQEADSEKALSKISQALIKIDFQMRQILDEIFDSNVSEMCAPSGSMFDPFNGEFRFEHIIDVLTKLYENNLNTEFKKMAAKVKKRTAKYTKGR